MLDAQQCQARLGDGSHLARAAIRLLGRRKVPLQPVYFRLLIERGCDGLFVDPLQACASAARLVQGLRPGTFQLHDLRAMHPADAGEGNHFGLSLAPSCEGGRPFAHAVERVDLLTGFDDAAVD